LSCKGNGFALNLSSLSNKLTAKYRSLEVAFSTFARFLAISLISFFSDPFSSL
jgi:hypothetical protein